MIRLDGGDPTVRDGFRLAFARLPAILGYAAISATVGMILRAIAERGGIVGAIGSMVVGVPGTWPPSWPFPCSSWRVRDPSRRSSGAAAS